MKPQNSFAFLALVSLTGAILLVGCNKDVTGKPESGVAANSESSDSSSRSVSAIQSDEGRAQTEAPAPPAEGTTGSVEKPSPEAPKEQPKPPAAGKGSNPPPAAGGGGQRGEGPGQGGPRGGMMRGWTAMLDQLNLTDAQKKKIEAILENANKRMQELRQQMDAQQGSLREKFTQIREETQKQIEAVLTAEQKAKWQQLRQEMEQRMRERARERGEGGPGGSGGSSGGQGRTGSGGNQEGSGRGA